MLVMLVIPTRSSLTQIFVTLILLVLVKSTLVSIDCPGTNPVVGILMRMFIEPMLTQQKQQKFSLISSSTPS